MTGYGSVRSRSGRREGEVRVPGRFGEDLLEVEGGLAVGGCLDRIGACGG